MKVKDFKYEKKDGKIDDYSVLILNDGNEYITGIDLNKLNEDEKVEVTTIVEKFEAELKPFMKAYRKFITENIIHNEESTKKE